MTEPLTTASSSAPQSSVGRGLIKAVRPKQWAKNVLVFVAPGAAGVLTKGLFSEPTYLIRTVGAFVVFSAASGGTYLLNDVIDRDAH